jgi:hypothetical protein
VLLQLLLLLLLLHCCCWCCGEQLDGSSEAVGDLEKTPFGIEAPCFRSVVGLPNKT